MNIKEFFGTTNMIFLAIMLVLLLITVSIAGKQNEIINECNKYWIKQVESGHVIYYGEQENPINYTLNISLSEAPTHLYDYDEAFKNDY